MTREFRHLVKPIHRVNRSIRFDLAMRLRARSVRGD